MIHIYHNLRKIADAIADSDAIQGFCVEHFGRGCLVQVDDIADNPISSDDAPWIIVAKGPSGEMGPVQADTIFTAHIVCGVSVAPLIFEEIRPRTPAGNGLRYLPGGDLAEMLLRHAILAIRGIDFGDGIIAKTIGLDVDVYTLSPLQFATCDVEISEAQSMNTW